MRAYLLGPCLLGLLACGGNEPDCIEQLSTDCTPLYTPSFDQVFAQTLAPKCGVGQGNCHDASGARGGLVLVDQAAAHSALLNGERVQGGEPACSDLIKRLEGSPGSPLMPPGAALSPEERCAVIQWVAAGADP